MTVPFRTFALLGLAVGMMATGYLFAPTPGASTPLPGPPAARTAAAPESQAQPSPVQAKSAPVLAAHRPPVPLVTQSRGSYFQQATVERPGGASASGDKPTIDMGTFNTNPSDPNDKSQALLTGPGGDDAQRRGNDAQARRAIEFDGYKNVRNLEMGPDGTWRGRAMRGRTEIAVKVDATGNVSAE